MKLDLRIKDKRTRRIWKFVQESKAVVASWPAWKRGDDARPWPPHTKPADATAERQES